MKVALPKNNGGTQKQPPPLSLVPEEPSEEDETKLAKFKLRTEPTDADSPTYYFSMMKCDGSGNLRSGIRFMTDIQKVNTGMNVTTATGQIAMYRQMLSGEGLNQFNLGVTTGVDATHNALKNAAYNAVLNATPAGTQLQATTAAEAVAIPPLEANHINQGLRALITYMAPHKALAKQKRWLRRFCRKPADMTVRTFANHITRINRDELPNMPPFGNAAQQQLSVDEIIDIILNGIPRSWTREMDKQDFDPVTKSLTEVIHFCERMEAAEDFEPARDGVKTISSKKDKNKSTGKSKSSSGGNKYCLLHGTNDSHTSDECHVLKKQAKSLRRSDDDKKPEYKNKTWKRDAAKSTTTSKKELATFVRKQARKELYAFAKKRKVSEDDDEQSTASLNNVEMEKEEGEVDLSVFNFGNMDDLKIDSEDDGSDGDEISV